MKSRSTYPCLSRPNLFLASRTGPKKARAANFLAQIFPANNHETFAQMDAVAQLLAHAEGAARDAIAVRDARIADLEAQLHEAVEARRAAERALAAERKAVHGREQRKRSRALADLLGGEAGEEEEEEARRSAHGGGKADRGKAPARPADGALRPVAAPRDANGVRPRRSVFFNESEDVDDDNDDDGGGGDGMVGQEKAKEEEDEKACDEADPEATQVPPARASPGSQCGACAAYARNVGRTTIGTCNRCRAVRKATRMAPRTPDGMWEVGWPSQDEPR